jgi:hypothetical protein
MGMCCRAPYGNDYHYGHHSPQKGFPVTSVLAPIRHPHTECSHRNTKVARAACRRKRAREWETINRDQINGRMGFDVRVHTVNGVVEGSLLGWGSRAMAVRDAADVRVRITTPQILAVEIRREMEVEDL